VPSLGTHFLPITQKEKRKKKKGIGPDGFVSFPSPCWRRGGEGEEGRLKGRRKTTTTGGMLKYIDFGADRQGGEKKKGLKREKKGGGGGGQDRPRFPFFLSSERRISKGGGGVPKKKEKEINTFLKSNSHKPCLRMSKRGKERDQKKKIKKGKRHWPARQSHIFNPYREMWHGRGKKLRKGGKKELDANRLLQQKIY